MHPLQQPLSTGSDCVRFPDIFHPLLNSILCCIFPKSLVNWHLASAMDYCHGKPAPSDEIESVCRHFPLPPQLYTLLYTSQVSRELTSSKSDGLLPWQPVSIGSDRICLPTFSTPSSTLYFAVYFLSLSKTDFRWVWLFMALVHRTEFECIGQPFNHETHRKPVRNQPIINSHIYPCDSAGNQNELLCTNSQTDYTNGQDYAWAG